MLDFGFSEILLTSAIALVVLGPEKLPKVARQVGNWMGRARVMARQLTEQLEREVNAEEFTQQQKKAAAAISAAVNGVTAAAPPNLSDAISGAHTSAAYPEPLAPTGPMAATQPSPAAAHPHAAATEQPEAPNDVKPPQ